MKHTTKEPVEFPPALKTRAPPATKVDPILFVNTPIVDGEYEVIFP